MAHNLYNNQGAYAYIGRQAAWHGLGTVTGSYMTWDEIAASGLLNYSIVKQQLNHPITGDPINAWATFRLDPGKTLSDSLFLGTVGEDYKVIQHGEGFKMLDALVNSVDGAHYETAGALGDGERVWGLADLGLSINVGADKQNGYIMFVTGHDGSTSHQYRLVFTRVVCQNTLSAAMSERTKAKLVIRHTKNADVRLANAHEALANIKGDMLSVEEKLRFLATRKITRETASSLFDRLFPKSKDAEGAEKESTRRDNIISNILALYESNDGDAFPEQRGTAYNLLNAVTEYTDHVRLSNTGARVESAMFGSGDTLKSKTLDYLTATAASLPAVPAVQTFAAVPAMAQVNARTAVIELDAPAPIPKPKISLDDVLANMLG